MTNSSIIIEMLRMFWALSKEGTITENDSKESVINQVLWGLGINIYLDGPEESVAPGAYGLKKPSCLIKEDKLLQSDGEMTLPTFVGKHLINAEEAFDYETPSWDRNPKRLPKDGEETISYGDAWVEWVGVAPCSPRLDDTTVEFCHLLISKEAGCLLRDLKRKKEEDRKAWGREQNRLLKEAGCSSQAISAWWSLSWKREWGPIEWAEAVASTETAALELALRAHAGWALDMLGFGEGLWLRSFPRRKDGIRGLAKARAKELPAMAPTRVVKDGSAVWSF